MSNGIADSAVGAILEIPPQALNKINEAEKAIKQLALTSAEAAGKINDHWGVVAPSGLDKFIQKLAEAKAKMDGLGTINVTLNTQAAVQSTEQLSTATQRTSADVSRAVQDMAQSWNDLAKVGLKDFNLSSYGTNLTEVLLKLKQMKQDFKNEPIGSKSQAMADEIRQLEEAIRLYKQAAEEKNNALNKVQRKNQDQTDKEYLTEQKRLLDRILQLRKDIANISISVQRGTITGKEDMSKDLAQLEQLRKELRETGNEYRKLQILGQPKISNEAFVQSQIQSQNAKNAGLRQEIDERNKLNQAITRANELTAQGQQGKTRLGSGEEAAIQRQLNSDYKAMIGIIREKGQIQANAAEQGRRLTQQELDLITALDARYKIYESDIQRVSSAYSKMAEAAARNFQADKSEQLARNAIALADAQNKAAEAAQKVADAQAKAAQQQADKDRSQAESDLNRLYTERLRLLKEKEQLENKALVNTAKGLPDLTAKENQLLSELTAKLQTVDNQIQTIGNTYRGLQLKAQHAFGLPELRQAVQLQNLLNDALKSVDTSNAKQLTAEYKRLTAEAQKLAQSMREYTAAGGDRSSAAYTQLEAQFASIMARRRELQRLNIDEIEQYRQQRQTAAYQADLSAFVQNEAQKTAEAKKQADERTRQQAEAQQKYLNSAQGAMWYSRQLNKGNIENSYENRERAIKQLESAIKSLDSKDKDYDKTLEKLTRTLNILKNAQQEVADAMKPTKPMVSPQDAINAAKNATTLNQLQDAYKQLKEVMQNMNPNDPQWKALQTQLGLTKNQIDEIKKKLDEFKSQTSKTSNTLGQLQSRIAAAFSVGAIMGFIKKMTEVRAQFELQRVALGAIIQDRDEANKIFTQVQNMALESPFNIMQLEKATKQIAAFGFETQKLVPTMKMFADISAGLGVEIDRLVLVMGHLKARGFLEGTMTRQFTNMGFNVLGELSKYYSELENKMVSVGEVQDRVKKKMVSFEDVEEVLKRVTSAGGMFYDMQKKQSDSLWGQMQRIKDAYDLMLNEIGQSNEGSIKAALTLIRSLINHWRALALIIKATGAAIMWYFTVSRWSAISASIDGVATMFKNMKVAIMEVNAAQQTLNATQKANAWGLLASLIAAATVAIIEYATAQSRLNESMDRVRNEGIGNMYDLIYQYQKLADTVRDTNKPYEEQKEALDEIKRIYADILPAEMLEIKNIKEMADGYERATEAIKAYSAEKIKSNLKAEVENIVGKEIQDEGNDLAGWFATFAKIWDLLPEKMPVETFRSMVKTMIAEISEEVKNGEIPVDSAFDELKKLMQDRLKNLMPKDALDQLFERFESRNNVLGESYFKAWEESLQKFQDQINGIDIGFEGAESGELVIVKKQYEDLTKAVDEYKKAIEALRLAKEKGKVKGNVSQDDNGNFTAKNDGQEGQKALDNLSQAYKKLQGQVQRYGVTWNTTSEDINAAIESQTGQMGYYEQTNEKVFGRILSGFSRWQERFRKDDSVKAWVENAEKEKDKLDLSDVQNKILGVALSVTSANGMQVKSLDKLRLASLNSFGDAAKAAQSVYNQLAANETAIQTQIKTLMHYGRTAAQAKTLAESEYGGGLSLEEIKEMMNLYKELILAFGGTFKDQNNSGSDKELKRWQDLKKAIESVKTAYEKARKSFTEDESNKMIEERWGSVFKALGADIKDFYKNGVYDMEALTKAYQVLIDKAQKAATTEDRKKFLSELIASQKDTEIELKVKLQEDSENELKKQLEEMFDSYELTNELKKAGISVDLTYMVGGKPTTKEDIRKEIERLRKEGGGSADAENRIKILEDAEKKLTQIELKEQKERLKNYEKYLKQMYSDRAQKMIEAYTDMKNMEQDFNSFIAKLQEEASKGDTTDARKQQIAEQIKSLMFQKDEAIKAVNEALNQNLAKLDWEQFKGSDVFTQLYQDTENLSKKGIDLLIKKLEDARTALQSMDKVDYRAVREITNHIEKLQNVRLDTSSWGELTATIKKAKETIGDVSLEDAQKNMIDAQSKIDAANIEIAQIQAIIDLKEQEGDKDDKIKNLSEEQKKLYKEDTDALRKKLKSQQDIVREQQAEVDKNEEIVDSYEEQRKAIKKKISIVEGLKQDFDKVYGSVVDVADALGADTDMWADFGQAIADSIFSCITLTLQFQLMGIAANSSLGVIGWIATALQVVANLLVAIFKQHDKKLQKQIDDLQERVDKLSKAYEKLEKAIERAFTVRDESRLAKQAIDNLNKQKRAYEEMIRLEEAKKKTDDDKIKDYKDKLDDLAEAEEEFYENRRDKWGSTNSVWDEANDWVDAWLDAYKETGDGLSALNESWDEFYENLVKKQAASKVLGARMDKWIEQINNAIDAGIGGSMSELDIIEEYKRIGENIKADMDAVNGGFKEIFKYAGIGNGTGELILSDLQKGIQNITEPQAAAIEAYLNSMRFAVFRHTEQLDTLIAAIQMQYGSGAESPVVTELKGIRRVLDSIDGKFDSIIGKNGFQPAVRIIG